MLIDNKLLTKSSGGGGRMKLGLNTFIIHIKEALRIEK